MMLQQNVSFSLILSLFMLCLIGSYPFLHELMPRSITLPENSRDPDAFATNITAFYLNQEGKLQTQFQAPVLRHYDYENKTDFELPHFFIYHKNGSPWQIVARHGQATLGIESVQLWNDVKIHQDPSQTHHELNLKTSEITLHPKMQTANTDKPVLLIQPGYQVSAVGVALSLKDEKIDLLSRANGQFNANFLHHPST